MIMVLSIHNAIRPLGNPVDTVLIPVAPVVVCVIKGSRAVLIHRVGVIEAALAVIAGVTVIVPVALTLPQPPVSGIL